MERDELLRLLNLNETRAGPDEGPALVVSGMETRDQPAGEPSALEVDAWGLRRGRDLLSESERLQGFALDEWAVADCHAAAFDPEPRLTPACRDATRREFFAALLETPEYWSLHQATRLDPVASEIAALHFAEQLHQLHKEVKEGGDMTAAQRDVATMRAAGKALAEAESEVHECREAAAALGLGPGTPGTNDPRAIGVLFRRVRHDPTLRRICTLAGRYRRLAQSRQRQKSRHGLDDMVGVEFGGDLGRVLPQELVRFAIPELEIDALRRLGERQLMCREYRGVEPVAKGPIIVCVDESGSMTGEPVHTAKALALALAWIARQQRRWCALVAYSGDTGERILPLPPARWNETALADWLCEFLGRGSSLDVPVREMPRIYRDLHASIGETDVLFVTDCRCSIPESVRDPFLQWKATVRARLLTLVLGDDAGDLIHVSDEVHCVRTLDLGEEAVGRVVSI